MKYLRFLYDVQLSSSLFCNNENHRKEVTYSLALAKGFDPFPYSTPLTDKANICE